MPMFIALIISSDPDYVLVINLIVSLNIPLIQEGMCLPGELPSVLSLHCVDLVGT